MSFTIKCPICLKRWWFSTKVKCKCKKQKTQNYGIPISFSSTQSKSSSHDHNRVIEHLILQTVVLDSSDSGKCHQVIHQEQTPIGEDGHSSCTSSSGYSSGYSNFSASSYESGDSSSSSWE
ncbi:Uncharacterised protein [Acinetobacter junii]|uniref:hypothetical protein n=1 Tax=Acinetobacter junii TaxID=40215 RepID=UPI0002CF796B|nr:hypothetical protein [Acinetobacter junii]ENV67407.1 hypothetical protein F948_00931 [Acinetobacter junii CIP 64.5]SUU19588.1 Uncharacterised protein [Acinetobacter junii]SUU22135.1 Uncharacterised protein [Acinetobacter junii]